MIRTTKISLLLAATLCSFGGIARASNYSYFTSPPSTMGQGTIGFTFAGNKFVGTVLLNGTGSLYTTDLLGNNAQPFAPGVSLTSSTQEHYVAGSFGYGFGVGDVYAADGSNIVHISNNGATSSTFVSGLSGEVRGIMFDQGGTFGNQMLVTTSSGEVYTVTNAGIATALANLSQNVEGLDIAPSGFGSFGGQLIVSSENGGGLFWAVKPNGSVTPLPFTVPSAEESTFVPLSLAPGNSTLVGLYGSDFMPDVLKAPGNAFLGLQGDLIVTGETTGNVSRVHWDPNTSSFVVSAFDTFTNQPEDGIFVTQQMVDTTSTPEPSTFILAGMSAAGLAIALRRRRSRAAASAT